MELTLTDLIANMRCLHGSDESTFNCHVTLEHGSFIMVFGKGDRELWLW